MVRKLIFAFLLLSASLAIRLESSENHELAQSHELAQTHELAQSHELALNHEEPISAIIGVISAATALAKLLIPLFDVSCSKYGYKRSNNINIFNDLNSGNLYFRG